MVMTMTLMTLIDDDSDDDTDDEDGEHDDEDDDDNDDAGALRWPQGRSNRCQDRRSAGFLAANFQDTCAS